MSESKPQFDLFTGAQPSSEAPPLPPASEEAKEEHPLSDAAPVGHTTLSSLVGKLTHAIDELLSPGEVADLRRLDPNAPYRPAFWKVAARYLEHEIPLGGEARDEMERRWAAILSGMAQTQKFHQPGRRLGQALAEAGLSELRLTRLLRARGEKLLDELRGVVRVLASKGQAFDWTHLANLVLSEGYKHEEKVRRQIARDYFYALEKQ